MLVRMAGGGKTVRMRRYEEVIDPVARVSNRTLAFGPVDVPGFVYDDRGRRTAGAGRMLMVASGISQEFDAQPALGGSWTVEQDDGREIPLTGGVTGVRPDNVTVAYWTAALQESAPGAGEGAAA